MSNTGGSPTPAGWYRDPAGSDKLRWWDGNAWTAHLTPVPSPQPVPTPTPPVAPAYAAQAVATPRATETVEPPYVPFQNSWDTGGGALGQAQARPTQWNTGSSWLLATAPLWTLAIELAIVVITVAMGTPIGVPSVTTSAITIAIYLVIFLIEILAAVRDHNALRRWGYRKISSPAWILLGPLGYLIARTVRVYAEAKRGIGPLVFLIVSTVCVVFLGIAAAVVIPIYLAEHGGATSNAANATSLASGITTGLDKSGGSYSVTCVPFAQPATTPIQITCTAIDETTRASHTLFIEIDPATGGGQPTFRLLNVTPPIAQ